MKMADRFSTFSTVSAMMAVAACAGFVCAPAFCAQENNIVIMDNAIALSIIFIMICLILLALILIPVSNRNPLNCFSVVPSPVR